MKGCCSTYLWGSGMAFGVDNPPRFLTSLSPNKPLRNIRLNFQITNLKYKNPMSSKVGYWRTRFWLRPPGALTPGPPAACAAWLWASRSTSQEGCFNFILYFIYFFFLGGGVGGSVVHKV